MGDRTRLRIDASPFAAAFPVRVVSDVIGVTVSGENIIGAIDHANYCRFVGPPLGTKIGLSTSQKRIDENDRLSDLNRPTRIASSFERQFLLPPAGC